MKYLNTSSSVHLFIQFLFSWIVKYFFYNTNIKSYCRFETANSISLIISFVIKIKDIFTFTWVGLQKKKYWKSKLWKSTLTFCCAKKNYFKLQNTQWVGGYENRNKNCISFKTVCVHLVMYYLTVLSNFREEWIRKLWSYWNNVKKSSK